MSDSKADYSEIAPLYDRARPSDSPHLEWWFGKLTEAGGLGPGRRLIDLGCGTGRWTIPLAERTGCEAAGLDRSPEMLARAQEKDAGGRVTWLVGDVERLELAPDSFDCALMSLMLHHLEDHLETFRGVRRILRPGAVFLIRQGTLEQIINDATHRFFPETVTLDRKRTPLRAEVERWLAAAGFRDISAEEIAQTSYSSNENFLERSGHRVCSVLRMISDASFEEGMKRMREYVTAHPEDASLRQDLFTLFAARKPE